MMATANRKLPVLKNLGQVLQMLQIKNAVEIASAFSNSFTRNFWNRTSTLKIPPVINKLNKQSNKRPLA